MAIDFPSTSGQATDGSFTHTHNGLTWSWDGTSWIKEDSSSSGSVDLSNYVKKTDTTNTTITRSGASSYFIINTESYFDLNADAQCTFDVGNQVTFDVGSQFQVDATSYIKFESDSYFEVNSTHTTFKDSAGTTSFARIDSNGLNLYSGGIRDKDGNLGSPGEVLSTTGSQIEWIPNSGGSGSGTSMEHDLWVLTTAPDNDTTMSYNGSTIGDGSSRNGDLGRPSTTFYNKNGTGMSESNGAFTFPSIGQWEIKADVVVYTTAPSGAGQDQSHQVWIEHTKNGMSGPWVTVASSKTTETLTSSGSYDVETIHNHFIINVTDIANEHVRFKVTSQAASTIENAIDKTQFWFKLLESGSTTNTGGGANNFTDLGDTPNSHDASKWLKSEGGNLVWTTAPLTGIEVQNTGVALSTLGTTLNFTGAVTASGTGSTKTITITDTNTTYATFTGGSEGLVPDGTSAGSTKYLRSDGSWQIPTDTTYTAFTGTTVGLVPSSTSNEQSKYLRSDGTWQIPTNTTYGVFQGVASGLVPASTSGETTKFLRSDGTWQTVSSADGNDYVTGAALGTGADAKKLTLSFGNTSLNKTVDLSSIDTNTTYTAFTGTTVGLVPDGTSAGSDKYLRSDGSWQTVTSGGGADGNDYVTNLSLDGTTLKAEFSDSSLDQTIDLAGIDTDTTYSSFTGTDAGLVPNGSSAGSTKFLRSDGTWVIPVDTNTTYGVFQGTASGLVPASTSGVTDKFLRSDGTWQVVSSGGGSDGNDYVTGAALGTGADAKVLTLSFSDTSLNKTVDLASIDTNTTYSAFTGGNQGLVPNGSSAGSDKFLRSDGTWVIPTDTDTDTTYSEFAGTTAGLVPTSTSSDDTKFLRADGTWVVPTDTNTTYSAFTGGNQGLVPNGSSAGNDKYLRSDGTWQTVTSGGNDGNTTYSLEALISPGVKLTGSDNSNDSVFFDAGTGISLTRTSAPGASGGGTIEFAADTFAGADEGLVPNGSSAGSTKFLRSDGTWVIPTDTNTTYSTFAGADEGLVPNGSSAGSTKYLRSDGTWQIPTDTNTTYSAFTGGNQGLVPNGSSAGSTKYLRSDGTWQIPTDTNTTYSAFTGGNQGLVPNGSSAGNDKFLRSDGSWADAGGGNPTIRTDNDSDWHYPIFVDSSTDNISQILKLDSGLKYYPGANWLQLTSVQCQKMYDWGSNSYGVSGQFLMSKGASSWQWSTYIHQETNGEIRLSGPTGATTSLEGAHLQFEDMNGNTSYAIDVYRNSTGGSTADQKKVLRFIDQSTGTERFSVGPEGQWGIGHVGGRSFGSLGQVMVSRGPDLSPQWANHSAISGSEAFATNAQGAKADVADAEIDHIYSQLNAIGNDPTITSVAQIKTALLALVRN